MKYLLVLILLFSVTAKADPMKDFLLTCAYGTAAGAAIGLATLAFTDNPNGKISNVARGASLGLYAGIAYGLIVANDRAKNGGMSSDDYSFKPSPVMITAQTHQGKVDGLQAQWLVSHF